jgi:arylsulfatase A-like enzyme
VPGQPSTPVLLAPASSASSRQARHSALPSGTGSGVLQQVAELQDILHTCLAVAGIAPPPGARLEGQPLTCLLTDPTGASCGADGRGWRQWVDAEHDVVYNASNHWSALTDGRAKYIFRAQHGDEQLFNLTAGACVRACVLARVELAWS